MHIIHLYQGTHIERSSLHSSGRQPILGMKGSSDGTALRHHHRALECATDGSFRGARSEALCTSMHQGHVEGVQLSVASVLREEWILHARTIDPSVCARAFCQWTQIVYPLAQDS